MAKNKSTSKAAQEAPKTDRAEISFFFVGRSLSQMATHLNDISSLLYENQDKFKNDSMIVGIESLLASFASELEKTAGILGWSEAAEGGAE